MKKILLSLLILGAAQIAQADTRWSINLGIPLYSQPAYQVQQYPSYPVYPDYAYPTYPVQQYYSYPTYPVYYEPVYFYRRNDWREERRESNSDRRENHREGHENRNEQHREHGR
jgi:hypothetical protein